MNRLSKKTAGALVAATLAVLAAMGTQGPASAATTGGAHSTAVSAVAVANTDSYASATVQQIIDLASAATRTQLGAAQSLTLTTLGADKLFPAAIKAVLAGNTVGGVKPLLTDYNPKATNTLGGYAGQVGVPAEATNVVIITPDGTVIEAQF